MSTRKIKTSELTGAALDWAVAKTVGNNMDGIQFLGGACFDPLLEEWLRYSTDWSQGGPIIERENITIIRANDEYIDGKRVPNWFAETDQCVGHNVSESYECHQIDRVFTISADDGMYGPTPLIAAMRCFVHHRLGDTVDIPEELL